MCQNFCHIHPGLENFFNCLKIPSVLVPGIKNDYSFNFFSIDCLIKLFEVQKNETTGIMLTSFFKTLLKETLFISPKTLLEPTSTKIFFKNFDDTLTKRKIKAKKVFEIFGKVAFQRVCIAMFSSIWKKKIATETERKDTCFIENLENNCSKTSLKLSNSKFMVKILI